MDSKIQSETERKQPVRTKSTLWRNLIAYWLLGLCNNYGYVVMLSAAHDILEKEFHDYDGTSKESHNTRRQCNTMSTGAILLADIIPALIVKLTAPFLPTAVNTRVLVAVILSAAGFLLVAFAPAEWVAIMGVVSMSTASGLGEVTFLTYSSHYNRKVVSAWSSGTGGAGIIGAVSYAGLTALGLSAVTTLLIMLIVPIIMAITFWCILISPTNMLENLSDSELGVGSNDKIIKKNEEEKKDSVLQQGAESFKNKLQYMPSLLKYMIPLGLVYFFEYFINQGLFELVQFDNIWIDYSAQYRWLQVDYQIGVFISRSSVNIVQINKIWLMALLQFINVIIFMCEVLFYFSPTIWIIFILTLWEGLLGGGAYVNTFYRISKEIPDDHKEFSLGVTSLADSIGIALAGFLAIPTHNGLCNLDTPKRLSF